MVLIIFSNRRVCCGIILAPAPIYFSFTIPTTVKNIDGAVSFGDFILSTSGKNILRDEGLNPIDPIVEGNMASVPPSIRGTVQN
jgi:molybdate/tungstate transport system substrate-binding protein